MDKPRKQRKGWKWFKRITIFVILIGGGAGVTIGLNNLEPAAKPVSRQSVVIGEVKRGLMLRLVRGNGSLVPIDITIVPSPVAGQVLKVLVLPGTIVKEDTILVVLDNPELENAAFEAKWQLISAEAEYAALEKRLETELLDIEIRIAQNTANLEEASLQAQVDETLYKSGDRSELDWKVSKVRVENSKKMVEFEKRRLIIRRESAKTDLARQDASVQQARATLALRNDKVASLLVMAGTAGVLDQMEVEVGQRVTDTTQIARVINPTRLKAELRIPETQVRDVLIGQAASIDTRNGIIEGVVIRIDPAVQNNTVAVDIRLDGELPKGARPDLNVSGTIELERLDDVLHMGRPIYAQAYGTIGLFILEPDGIHAVRRQVTLGAVSVTKVEIREGLELTDQVITSDTSTFDDVDRIRLR
ncbi:MAG: HlyD family efflux transporter periplasmic adaptor subunit [Planctomycetota bacterium]|nr:HlyD family efflux transporter periplasmic adaptor subunit [Planctomycetota bacterium]